MKIYVVFITQSYFPIPKDIRFNSTRYLILKIHIKRELQDIAISRLADVDTNGFIKIFRACTSNSYSFLTIDAILRANIPLHFIKNLFNSLMMI